MLEIKNANNLNTFQMLFNDTLLTNKLIFLKCVPLHIYMYIIYYLLIALIILLIHINY